MAAISVVLTHVTTSEHNPGALLDFGVVAGRFTELGYLGVTFFFVLSGFVLTWSAPENNIRAWDFYRRRFARVYPLHVATTLVAGAAILISGGAVAATAWPLCLLLVQAWVPSSTTYFALNPVSWSLACEAFFYLLTPLLLGWARKRSLRACTAAAAAPYLYMLVTTGLVLVYAPERDQDVWFSPWFSLGAFTSGMLLALAIRRGLSKWPSLVDASGACIVTLLLLVLLSSEVELNRTVSTVLALPALLLVIGAAALRDIGGNSSWLSLRWMVKLGEWSFALYLIHKILLKFFADYFHLAGHPAFIIAAIALIVAASGAVHYCYERPLERLLRPSTPRRRVAVRAPARSR